MNTLFVMSQKQFDEISDDYQGQIIISFGNYENLAIINRIFKNAQIIINNNRYVKVCSCARVEVYGESFVEARDSALLVVHDNSFVVARENSVVVAMDSVGVIAWENSVVYSDGKTRIESRMESRILDISSEYIFVNENSCVLKLGDCNGAILPNKEVLLRSVNDEKITLLNSGAIDEWNENEIKFFYKSFNKIDGKFF